MRAHVFDMDGTLLRGTSAPMLVGTALGRTDALSDLERRFAGGDATAVDFARALHSSWGVVAPEISLEAFEAAPVLANVREVLADIHERGELACLVTMSPAYFAEHFREWGFDEVYATPFPTSAQEPLDESTVLHPRDKPRLAEAFCAEHGLRLVDAVAYGDSMSDVFLFEQVGFRVSVNGDHHLETLADVAVETEDLRAAYEAARRLLGDYRWDPETYLELMAREVPDYPQLQDEVVAACAVAGGTSVLDLGIGSGLTARRVADRLPGCTLVGIDADASMLAAARELLDPERTTLVLGRLEQALPQGPFDLIASMLAVHHLDAAAKQDLIARVAELLVPGGAFVLGDLVVPVDPGDVVTEIDGRIDKPSSLAEHLAWFEAAGLEAEVVWQRRDLAVMVARRRHEGLPTGDPGSGES